MPRGKYKRKGKGKSKASRARKTPDVEVQDVVDCDEHLVMADGATTVNDSTTDEIECDSNIQSGNTHQLHTDDTNSEITQEDASPQPVDDETEAPISKQDHQSGAAPFLATTEDPSASHASSDIGEVIISQESRGESDASPNDETEPTEATEDEQTETDNNDEATTTEDSPEEERAHQEDRLEKEKQDKLEEEGTSVQRDRSERECSDKEETNEDEDDEEEVEKECSDKEETKGDGEEEVDDDEVEKECSVKEETKREGEEGDDEASSGTEETKGEREDDSEAPQDCSDEEETKGDGEEDEEEEDEDEDWELARIMSVNKLKQTVETGYTKCSYDECTLHACALYLSTVRKAKFYYCMDCQENDFGGWPDEKELPVKVLTAEHKRLMVDKCSDNDDPKFPASWEALLDLTDESPTKQSSPKVGKGTPTSPEGATTVAAKVTPTPTKPKAPSASALNMHRKWQEAAEKMGGPGARIIVSKKEAMKLIFEKMFESFCPMNITDLHQKLKALVPSPILRQCLDDMIDKEEEGNPFDEDDDEEGANKREKKLKSHETSTDGLVGSLQVKPGRTSNTTLYFIDHSKQKNNGNGMEPDKRNELYSRAAKANVDKAQLVESLDQTESLTKELLSTPTNIDAASQLEALESSCMELTQQLEDARKLKVNEKHRKTTKRRIETMTVQWRKRKRLCMDFLLLMEESTEGTISLKRCLKGDGKIDIESDETAVRNSMEFAKNRRKRSMQPKPHRSKKRSKNVPNQNQARSVPCLVADPGFIGMRLDIHGNPERVYLDGSD